MTINAAHKRITITPTYPRLLEDGLVSSAQLFCRMNEFSDVLFTDKDAFKYFILDFNVGPIITRCWDSIQYSLNEQKHPLFLLIVFSNLDTGCVVDNILFIELVFVTRGTPVESDNIVWWRGGGVLLVKAPANLDQT